MGVALAAKGGGGIVNEGRGKASWKLGEGQLLKGVGGLTFI